MHVKDVVFPIKAVFHFNRNVAKRSVFYCAHIISWVLALTKQ